MNQHKPIDTSVLDVEMSKMLAFPLVGKITIVTGASRGIGAGVARILAARGSNLVLVARDTDALATAAVTLTQAQTIPITVTPVAVDLRDASAIDEVIARTLAVHGKIDHVVTVAGAVKQGGILELTDDEWLEGYRLKFFSALRLVRAAWSELKKTKGSVVITAGAIGRTPNRSLAAVGTINAAIMAMAKTFADQGVIDQVRVNAINPGPVNTTRRARMIQLWAAQHGVAQDEATAHFIQQSRVTRFGEPEDIGHFVAFLLSPNGQWFHGSIIDLDGGETKGM